VGALTQRVGTALALAFFIGAVAPLGTVDAAAPAVLGPIRVFHVAGASHLHGVSCPTPDECAIVGWLTNGNPSGVVLTFINGKTGDVQDIGPGQLWGVSCGSDTACVGVGGDYNSFAITVPITNGEAGAPTSVDGSGMLYGAACATPTSCVFAGECRAGGTCPGTIVANGVVQSIPGSVRFYRVACSTAVDCLAVGLLGAGPDHAGVVTHVTS